MATRKKTATAEVIQMPPVPVEGVAYFSLRLKEQGHKLRYSHGPKLVEAERDQTIAFRSEPYPHFVVMPGGVQFPLENVASAIPMASQLTAKLSRTGKVNARKAEAVRKLQERALARAAASEPVDVEEDEPDLQDEAPPGYPSEDDNE